MEIIELFISDILAKHGNTNNTNGIFMIPDIGIMGIKYFSECHVLSRNPYALHFHEIYEFNSSHNPT